MSFISKGQKEIYFTNLHYFYICCKLLMQWENYSHRTYLFPEFLIFRWTIAGNPGIPWCPRFAFLQKNTCSWLRKTQWVHQIVQMNGLLHLPRFLRTCPMCSGVETFLVFGCSPRFATATLTLSIISVKNWWNVLLHLPKPEIKKKGY